MHIWIFTNSSKILLKRRGMNNMDHPLNIIRTAVVVKSVNVLTMAYKDIISSQNSQVGMVLKEDNRRNQIVNQIDSNRKKYKYEYVMGTESGTYNEQFETMGRIDICIYYSPERYVQQRLSFECKRFHSKNSGTAAIEEAYYTEGLKRYYELKYPCDTGFGGMIAFCEEGDYKKLKDNILGVLTKHATGEINDMSTESNHNYLHSFDFLNKDGENIRIISIMMNFSNCA